MVEAALGRQLIGPVARKPRRDHVAGEHVGDRLVAADHLGLGRRDTSTVPGRGSALKFDAPAS